MNELVGVGGTRARRLIAARRGRLDADVTLDGRARKNALPRSTSEANVGPRLPGSAASRKYGWNAASGTGARR